MEKKKESSEVKTDVKLLLECLQYQADNSSATKQALFTLASIFSNYDGSKDHFRSIGGLHYVFNIITSTTNSEVQESAFYCLGCCIENNVFCQKSLTSNSVFIYIHGVLSNNKCPSRLKQTATFFLLNLVSNNGQGQTLVRTTGCLTDLLQLLRSSFPKTEVFNRQGATESWFEDVGTTSVELWSSVASTLCMCVNNPRNDENQSRCGLELGFMFTLIQHCDNPSILRPLLSLVGFTVASNASTQRQVRQCGGLVVLIARLKVALDLALQQNSSESESHRAQISIAITIAGTIDSCILDNAENAEDLSKGDVIPPMMQLLLLGSLKQEDKLQVVLTLGHMLELSSESRTRIDEVTGLPHLVKLLTESEDEEFSKAVKYLLQMCIARNEKNQIEVEEENLQAVRRENGKKMLLRIDEISKRLKVIEKEAEEKSLLIQQPGQGLETVNTTYRDSMTLTPREKGLLFQLQQERDDRQRMEFLALQMHAPSPRTHPYGVVPRQCLSEENYPLRQGLNHQTFCYNTPEISQHQKHNLAHHGPCSMNNCPEYSKGIQTDGRGSCVLGPDGITRISHNVTKQQTSEKENNAPCEVGMYGQSRPPSHDIQMECFPQNKNHEHHCFLDHRGDRNTDSFCSESYRLCPTSNNYDMGLNKGEENTKVIDKEADSTVEVSCESRMRSTTTNNINSVSCPGTETGLVTQSSMDAVPQDQAVIQRSNSSTDLPIQSTRDMSSVQKKAPFVEKDSRTQHKETRTNISDSVLQDNSLNSNSAESHKSSGQCEITSSGTKSFTASESERKDVFLKPKLPSMTSCYRTPVKRPANTRMTPSLGSMNRSNSFVKHKQLLVHKPADEESYPDSDCSSVIDTRSEFDLELVKAAKKNTFSKYICYSVTPIRRDYRFNKTGKFSVQKAPSYIGGTPCSVKSIERMKNHAEESVNDSADSFSSEEDDWSDVENSETEENMECHLDRKPSEELKVSKCPGCTVWLSSPSNSKHMLMNSRTYNLLLETSLYTCEKHKAIRDCERKFIQKIRKNSKVMSKKRHLPPITTKHTDDIHTSRNTMSVYDFRTSESESDGRVTPPYSTNSCKLNLESLRHVIPRRCRIPYTGEEVENILTGVSQLGTRWNQILVTYKFHASRTATDLKDKYKRLVASQANGSEETDMAVVKNTTQRKRVSKRFSMCEERRLIRGVKRFGYNWKSILNSFSFSKGRTSHDLRNRWRNMHKKVAGM